MYTLRFDGLFRGIPAGSASGAGLLCYGWIINHNSVPVARGHGACIRSQDASSNAAEYLALIEGLDALRDLGVAEEPVVVLGDAQTIIDQMRGFSTAHAHTMMALYRRANRLARRFSHLSWVWTPRRENKHADLLTRKAMQQIFNEYQSYQQVLWATSQAEGQSGRGGKSHSLLDLRVFHNFSL